MSTNIKTEVFVIIKQLNSYIEAFYGVRLGLRPDIIYPFAMLVMSKELIYKLKQACLILIG